jgi:ABC-type phosphate transport system substrate-binding protein
MFRVVSDVAASYKNKEEAIGYSFRFFTENMMRNYHIDTGYFKLMIDLIPENDPDLRDKREKYQSEMLNLMKPIKLLSVDSIAPSEENIRQGIYPFTVNLFAVTAGTSNPHAQELIDWILSSEGQELVEKTGYIGIGNKN